MMKTASSDASHTTTVAPIHVSTPLMSSPSLKRSVITSAANVEISATPPTAAELDRPRIIAFVRNGVRSATATVKTISDRMKPVTLIEKSSKMSDATMSPTALPSRTMTVRTMNRITAPSL